MPIGGMYDTWISGSDVKSFCCYGVVVFEKPSRSSCTFTRSACPPSAWQLGASLGDRARMGEATSKYVHACCVRGVVLRSHNHGTLLPWCACCRMAQSTDLLANARRTLADTGETAGVITTELARNRATLENARSNVRAWLCPVVCGALRL